MKTSLSASAAFALFCLALGPASAATAPTIDPSRLPKIGAVSPRYQSYNVEMLEVTGGKFWKPYAQATPAATAPAAGTPAGMNPDAYAYRPPIDLSNARRRKLTAALAPAYVRVSGTWANTTYFAPEEAPAAAPAGFGGVLTRAQWKGVVDFARAVDAEIVTSFAVGAGVRDAAGVWTPDQAASFLDYTHATGGKIAAAEFMNEPDLAVMGGTPRGYTAENYARDYRLFAEFARAKAPGMLLLAPGTVLESDGDHVPPKLPLLRVAGVFADATLPIDVYAYHFYPAVSIRLAKMAPQQQVTPDGELTEAQLAKTDAAADFHRGERDRHHPGLPLWITETAEAAGGGNPWAATFLDSFRYLDQLGRLARQGVQVVMHNTLDASDYGLLDEDSLLPRPSYWAALLWHDLMGTTVLDAGVPLQEGLHVYAHSQKGAAGGVTVLVINTSKTETRTVAFPQASQRYTLSATPKGLEDTAVLLNGHALALGADDQLPELHPSSQAAGEAAFAPATITFLTFAAAANPAAR